jgi:hypothetical protein
MAFGLIQKQTANQRIDTPSSDKVGDIVFVAGIETQDVLADFGNLPHHWFWGVQAHWVSKTNSILT